MSKKKNSGVLGGIILILGILTIIGGIGTGLYVGIWVCFVGGIVDLISQIQGSQVEDLAVGWGVAKIFFAGPFGLIVGGVIVGIGSIITGVGTTMVE